MKPARKPLSTLLLAALLLAGCGGGGGHHDGGDASESSTLTLAGDADEAGGLSGRADDYAVNADGTFDVALEEVGRGADGDRRITIRVDPRTALASDGDTVTVDGAANTVRYERAAGGSNKVWNGTGGTITIVRQTDTKVSLHLTDVVLLPTSSDDAPLTLDGDVAN